MTLRETSLRLQLIVISTSKLRRCLLFHNDIFKSELSKPAYGTLTGGGFDLLKLSGRFEADRPYDEIIMFTVWSTVRGGAGG
jgi:hypothetical protein